MCIGFFFAAVLISSLRDALPKKYQAFVPLPMAAAIPFYIGAQLAVSHHHITLRTMPYNTYGSNNLYGLIRRVPP